MGVMLSSISHQASMFVSAAVATEAFADTACKTLPWISPGYCVMKQRRLCSRVRLAVWRGMCMPSELEALIDAINVELEAGNWSQVVVLTEQLHACAIA